MIYRIARILLEVVGIAIGGLLVVAAVAVWRLSSAPVDSRYLSDYLEDAIKTAHLGFVAHVTNARIEWHGFRPLVGVQFQGVSIVGEGGAAVGAFSDGTLGISARDLLFGRFSILEIDIRHPEITIVRDPDDHFSLRVGQQSGMAGANSDFAEFIQDFIERPSDNGPIGRLRRVHLVNGRITVDDQKTGGKWSAPNVDIDLARDAQATSGKIDIALDLPHHPARLFGRARHVLGERRNYISLDIDGFDAAAAAPFAAALSPLAPFAIPVSGHVQAVIDDAGSLISGDIELSGATGGMIVLPQFYSGPLVVRGLDMKAHFTGAPQVLELDRMAVDLGDAKLSAKGKVNFTGADMTIDSQVDVSTIPLARFDALWPHGMAAGGREWVTANIPDGMIQAGSVHVAGSGKRDDPGSITITSVTGTFDYTGLEVHYFAPLPPIKGIDGHGTFDTARMTLSIDSGQLGALAVSKGSAVLTGLDQEGGGAIDLNLMLAGPLKSALATLDMKPLGYAHDLGLAPEGVGGKAEMHANFSFPLIKSLLFSQIQLSAKGTLDGVSAANVIGSRAVDAGKFDIAVDKSGMRLGGTAKLAGVPMSLDWKESFLKSDKVRSHITFETEADDAQRTALAFNVPDLVGLKGKIGVKGGVTIDREHTTTLDLNADIGPAELTVDKIALKKASGDPGTADLSLVFENDALARIPHLHIAGKDLTVDGDIEMGPEDAFRRAHLTRVTTPRNDFTLLAEARPGDVHAYSLTIGGAKFDAAPLISAKGAGGPPVHTPRLDLKLALDTVLTGVEAHLDKVSGTATMTGSRLDRADLKAMAGGPLTFTYLPGGEGRTLTVSADDAGQTLAALGLTRGVRGGILRIDATTDTSKEPWRTTGTLDMKELRMTDAPIMARLVNAISPTGMVDLLSGQGLGFDHLQSEIEYSNGTFTFRNGRAAGALGISFEGEVNQEKDTVALKGTVVPVDTFNRLVSSIPLVGDLLTGGSRGGLFGWTYVVDGTTSDPKVSVNALSMFAPGVLRNLFFLGPEEPDAKDEKPADKPAESSAEPEKK